MKPDVQFLHKPGNTRLLVVLYFRTILGKHFKIFKNWLKYFSYSVVQLVCWYWHNYYHVLAEWESHAALGMELLWKWTVFFFLNIYSPYLGASCLEQSIGLSSGTWSVFMIRGNLLRMNITERTKVEVELCIYHEFESYKSLLKNRSISKQSTCEFIN